MSVEELERVEERVDELESQDRVTAEDLERFRRSLPTDSMIAEALQKALPPPWGDLFEYVSASERQSAYWRVRPDRMEARSEADRRAREEFAESARGSGGGTRTVLRETEDGGMERVRLPANALNAARELQGRSYRDSIDASVGERALKKLRNLLSRGD